MAATPVAAEPTIGPLPFTGLDAPSRPFLRKHTAELDGRFTVRLAARHVQTRTVLGPKLLNAPSHTTLKLPKSLYVV